MTLQEQLEEAKKRLSERVQKELQAAAEEFYNIAGVWPCVEVTRTYRLIDAFSLEEPVLQYDVKVLSEL